MIRYVKENIFDLNVDAIVNTINCVGYMGKGLAYEFYLRYPDLNKDYKIKCQNKEISLGKIYYYKEKKMIVNFPTKYHYKYPSKIEWIEAGLINFVETYNDYEINSIAFPLLGVGNGQLNSNKVKQLMEKYLSKLNITIYICEYNNEPSIKEQKMIERLQEINLELLEPQQLTNKVLKIINAHKFKIKKLDDLLKIPGIGKKTFETIFYLLYKEEFTYTKKIHQEKLF